jgi:hypothetical protein
MRAPIRRAARTAVLYGAVLAVAGLASELVVTRLLSQL